MLSEVKKMLIICDFCGKKEYFELTDLDSRYKIPKGWKKKYKSPYLEQYYCETCWTIKDIIE